MLNLRVAFKETIFSLLIFLRVIPTTGPPGLMGSRGPSTETISTDWMLSDSAMVPFSVQARPLFIGSYTYNVLIRIWLHTLSHPIRLYH